MIGVMNRNKDEVAGCDASPEQQRGASPVQTMPHGWASSSHERGSPANTLEHLQGNQVAPTCRKIIKQARSLLEGTQMMTFTA